MRAGRLPESDPLEQEARAVLRRLSPKALDAIEAEQLDRMARERPDVPQRPVQPPQRPAPRRWG